MDAHPATKGNQINTMTTKTEEKRRENWLKVKEKQSNAYQASEIRNKISEIIVFFFCFFGWRFSWWARSWFGWPRVSACWPFRFNRRFATPIMKILNGFWAFSFGRIRSEIVLISFWMSNVSQELCSGRANWKWKGIGHLVKKYLHDTKL
jgi:hypothetical protein